MRAVKPLRWLSRSRSVSFDGGTHGFRMKPLPFMAIVCTIMVVIVYRTTTYQYHHAEDSELASANVDYLPHGIIQANSDLELKPLWLTSHSRSKVDIPSHQSLLAIPAGIKQKQNVDTIVRKFFAENFTVILFHYDGHIDGWRDLAWNNKVIHIVALNQTKWWFAKRFLHPDVVSIYEYIFLWDEDLGVENFHPRRYLEIMKSEGLEISQPALDPNSTGIHHRITVRKRTKKVHRRVYDTRGSVKCSDASNEPPCTGFVEGMAPVFSRSAWRCAWHLIQNDLVHGWGMDMKLGYCAQGDRTKRVGVIDSEFIVHQGIQTLGGSSARKGLLFTPNHFEGEERILAPIKYCKTLTSGDELSNKYGLTVDLSAMVRSNKAPKTLADRVNMWNEGQSFLLLSSLHISIQHAGHEAAHVVSQTGWASKATNHEKSMKASKATNHEKSMKRRGVPSVDERSEIRRQSTSELRIFRQRWDKAIKEDKGWTDPFRRRSQRRYSQR